MKKKKRKTIYMSVEKRNIYIYKDSKRKEQAYGRIVIVNERTRQWQKSLSG